MNCVIFFKYRYLLINSVILIFLFISIDGCSSGDFKDRDRAIALVQNYQIGGKTVSERLSYALKHSTNDKISTIEWNALKNKKDIYKVTCAVKVGGREINFAWQANLYSNRITPLNMTTQDIMGGGYY